MPGKKATTEEVKPLKLTAFFKPDKVTKGAVRFAECTASGAKKPPSKCLIRTMYLRHEALPANDDGPVIPSRVKITVEQE